MKKLLLIIALSFYSINYSQNLVANWLEFTPTTASYPRAATAVTGNVSAVNLNFSNCAYNLEIFLFVIYGLLFGIFII